MKTVQHLNVPVGDLRKNSFNSNRVTPDNETKIRRSIERNGMFKPVIVREVAGIAGYEIIGGEHRWEQAVELGYTEIPIANLGEISDAKAKEISVIDNARYGMDDTLALGEILKDIDVENLQDILPYGETDLNAIFSASDIELDDLEIEGNFEVEESKESEEPEAPKPPKTHTIMRFRLPLGDAERLTKLVASTQKDEKLTTEDELTNAGDALVFILGSSLTSKEA